MWVQEFKKELKAKKFLLYSPVEVWNDGLYALKTGIEFPEEIVNQRKKEFDMVKSDYLRPTKKQLAEKDAIYSISMFAELGIKISDEKKTLYIEKMTQSKSDDEVINKSWAGTDLETMMLQLGEKGKFPGNLISSFQ